MLSITNRRYYLHSARKFRTTAAHATIVPLVLLLTHNYENN